MSKRIASECEPLLNQLSEQFSGVWLTSHRDYWASKKFHDAVSRLREHIADLDLVADVQAENFRTLSRRYRELSASRGPLGVWKRLVQAVTS